jgi:uncharacterized protein YjiS (DUF1127 family)
MSAYNVKAHPAFSGYELEEGKSAASGGIRSFFGKLALWLEERRTYRFAVLELESLGDRELADIGVSRYDIPAVARASAKERVAERRRTGR